MLNTTQNPVFRSLSVNPQLLSSGNFNGNAAAGAPAPVFSPENLQFLTQLTTASQRLAQGWQNFGDGQVRVAVIDDFVAEGNGFNHGQNIDQIVRNGNPNIQTVGFNIDQPGGDRNLNILRSLVEIGQRAANGEQFDAINLSQQDFDPSGSTAAINEAIRILQERFNIPVVVAAGNAGADEQNELARNADFVVENSELGSETRAQTSGLGNVRSEGEFTSQATANVTAQVAQLHEQGLSNEQIQVTLANDSAAQGGSLDRPAATPAPATPNPTAKPKPTPVTTSRPKPTPTQEQLAAQDGMIPAPAGPPKRTPAQVKALEHFVAINVNLGPPPAPKKPVARPASGPF